MIHVQTNVGPLQVDADRLASKLWIGSAPPEWFGSIMKPYGFDCLVLCAKEYQPPARAFPGVVVLHAPFDDAPELSAAEWRTVQHAARWVSGHVLGGRRTLVTCLAGRNRSGMVCARTLMKLSGAPAHLVVDHVKRHRQNALTNPDFVRELHGYAASRAVV